MAHTPQASGVKRPALDLAPMGRTLAEQREFVAAAEASGYGGAWIAEVAGADAVTTAAVVAGAMRRGRVGTCILPMQTRDPLLLAMTAATLAQAAPGGFVLGLGTSTRLIVEEWHATPWGRSPLRLTRECVHLVRQFLAGERVTTESGRWRYRRAQLSAVPSTRVPIYLAALNDRMLELAGEIADGVILNFVTVADVEHARRCVAAGAARAGRSLAGFEFVVILRATVTDDVARVDARYRRELFTYVMAPVYQQMFARAGQLEVCRDIERRWRAGERDQALAAIPPAIIDERVLLGPAAAVQERLVAYATAGMDTAIVMPLASGGNDYVRDCLSTVAALAPPVASRSH